MGSIEDYSVVAILVAVIVILSSFAAMVAASRPKYILYALAAGVSLVGINIHLGVTFYLSRIIVLFFLIAILIRLGMRKQICIPSKSLLLFGLLFLVLIFEQLVSALLSDHLMDGLRQISIYLSLMTMFVTVIIVGDRVEVITKAVKIYLGIGIVQGLYGLYLVIGGPYSLPTYQTLMAGIPTANDRTVGGYFYSGEYHMFRAIGFFPADVSHYAGYMAGILILAMALFVLNRRSLFLYIVLITGSLGLLFSLSRSGILAFVVFGIPVLFFLLWRVQPVAQRSFLASIKPFTSLALIIALGVLVSIAVLDIDLTNISQAISSRFTDLVDEKGSKNESMAEHIHTRLLGLDAFASSPFFGVGPGVNASPWFSKNYQAGWAGSHTHHINMLGETGLIGAGLEWLIMGLAVQYMWRGLFVRREKSQERNLLAGLLAAYITIILGNLLYSYYLNDFVWFLMACGVALSRAIIVDVHKNTIVSVNHSTSDSN